MDQLFESLKNNQTAIRYCIQYEVLDKKSPFDSFKSFCKRVGDDVMDFNEFEFWYMRFYHGKLDLDYDRNSEPKALKFSDLPNEMISEAVEKLDPVSRIVTRHVSKNLRCFVDRQESNIQEIKIDTTGNDRVSVSLDENTISYQKTERGCLIEYENQQISVENGDYLKLVLNDLKATMETQKLKVDNLYLKSETNENLRSILKDVCFSLCSQFLVKSLTIDTLEPPTMDSIICFMKPGVLENIKIISSSKTYSMSNLRSLEQWKQAKTLDLLSLGDLLATESYYFTHFISFSMRTKLFFPFVMVDLKNKLLKSSFFQKCEIHGFLYMQDLVEMGNAFGVAVRPDRTFRFPFPNSNDFLEFKTHNRVSYFERIHG